ncbi:MAG: acyl-CoA dehydrogenase family protein [Actinomycetota bacterium]|nr:acyl-CoA dehydrogenase family protein [Actinomycetota bacterium]
MTDDPAAAREAVPGRPRPGAPVYPDFALDGQGSPSRYRHHESGRGLNYYLADPELAAVLDTHLDPATRGWAEEVLVDLGERAGTSLVARADAYDAAGHQLVRYDRFGRDVSEIAYHPDWLTSLAEVFDLGLVGWNHDPARLERYGRAPVTLLTAMDYLVGQADMALCCPLELAHGTVVVLEQFASAEQHARFLPPVVATTAADRLQVAQVATEITGGSDVGATRTEAVRTPDGGWSLTGEKWFASNVGADLIVTMGRVDPATAGTRGLGLFVVPRRRSDGTPNGVSIRRLKDKMGTIGVPTGELILNDAEAHLVGDADSGFRYMAEMLNHTRYWNAVGSVGMMRRAYLEAATYTARRGSFGTTLDAFPMMRERLVWLQVDLAATTALLFHTGAALDAAAAGGDPRDALRFRTLAPVVKYRSGEQCVEFARAAVEMLGANGYTAPFGTPRLYRDAQVNPIWEGTSNICALDLWRAVTKQRGHEPVLDACEALVAGLQTAPARRLGEAALAGGKDVREAVDGLAAEPRARQEQQVRRLADLVGDVVALAALAQEAETDLVRRADHRRALLGELHAQRLVRAHSRRSAVLEESRGVPELYPLLVGEQPVGRAAYEEALALRA